jgi:hypothetical protein
MSNKFYQVQDLYPKLLNPKKYIGTLPLTCRSGWEISFAMSLDKNHGILEWSSESVVISYFDPIKKKFRRYFSDFFIKYKSKDGKIKEEIIEIKPIKEVLKPIIKSSRKSKRLQIQIANFVVNRAKWAAAELFCESLRKKGQNIKFKIITESAVFTIKNQEPEIISNIGLFSKL